MTSTKPTELQASPSQNPRRRLSTPAVGVSLALGLLTSLFGVWALSPRLSGHGLLARHGPASSRLEAVALVTSNDDPLAAPVLPVEWTGYLYHPDASEVVFRIPRDVAAILTVDGQVVFDQPTSASVGPEQAGLFLSAGAHPLTLRFTEPRVSDSYLQAGLEWRTAFGWRLVPAVYLTPQPPQPQAVQRVIVLAQLAWAAVGLALACSLGLLGLGLWHYRRLFRSRTAWGLLCLAALALTLRLLFLADRARSPTFDILAPGADQRSYQSNALDGLRGLWPAGPFYFKPGVSLLLVELYRLVGPSLRAAEIVQMVLGALTVGVVYAVARRIFNPLTGWLAAALWAIFPQPIFYEATVLTHGLEAVGGACLIWLWFRMVTLRSQPWVAACGLWLGALAILRPTFLAFAPALALILIWPDGRSWALRLRQAALFGAMVIVAILPVTWHNYQADGRFQLISIEGPLTLYNGNGRDSSGGVAEFAVASGNNTAELVREGKTSYLQQTLADIYANPVRWLQLMARKTAFLLSDYEVPNNVNFNLEGLKASPTLAALPVRLGEMQALAILGFVLVLCRWRAWNESRWVLLIYVALNALLFVAFVVHSRLKAPLYPALAILAGWVVAIFVTALRKRQWPRAAGLLALALASRAGVANMLWEADHVMSRPIFAALPPAAKVINAPLDADLVLVGYDPLPVVKPGEQAIIGLYWQSPRAWSSDLVGTVKAYSGADEWKTVQVAQQDHLLGGGLIPRHLTSQWKPGQIVRDQYLLEIPPETAEPQALKLEAAACYQGNGECLGEATFGPLPLTAQSKAPLPAQAQPVGAKIGNATLLGFQAKSSDPAGIVLTLYWRAEGPMAEDAIVFVHILDAEGKLVVGLDSRPRNGTYSFLAWQPGETVVDEHLLAWPATAPTGKYQLAIGIYSAATQNRWAARDAGGSPLTDNILPLGLIFRPD